jgi:hypothetical protein
VRKDDRKKVVVESNGKWREHEKEGEDSMREDEREQAEVF